ncbi:MAG: heat shock protein HspQ [Nitrospiria bacterium]
MNDVNCQFFVGQLIHHQLFGYRGVVVDVDPDFQGTEEWYAQVARSQPPKDQPWYHVLVHQGEHMTYVAERNLEPDKAMDEIEHPLVKRIFTRFEGGRYIRIMS